MSSSHLGLSLQCYKFETNYFAEVHDFGIFAVFVYSVYSGVWGDKFQTIIIKLNKQLQFLHSVRIKVQVL